MTSIGGALLFLAGSTLSFAAGASLVSRSSLTANSGNGASTTGRDHPLSPNGRYLAFTSAASDLVPGDTNGVVDVFVFDRQTQTITRVSVDSGGGQANADSSNASISADGRYVVFVSKASNLVSGDINELSDIFLHDRKTGATTAVSIDSRGLPAGGTAFSFSSDGNFIVYCQHESGAFGTELLVYERPKGRTKHIPIPPGPFGEARIGSQPSTNSDGRYIAFTIAGGVVDEDFVLEEGCCFDSRVYRYDRFRDELKDVSVLPDALGLSFSYSPSISGDGQIIAFGAQVIEDIYGHRFDSFQMYVYDAKRNVSNQVNVSPNGAGGTAGNPTYPHNPSVSPDGRYVAFTDWSKLIAPFSPARTFAYVYDRFLRVTRRANDLGFYDTHESASYPAISTDGRVVAYTSTESSFVANDLNNAQDVFLYDVPQRLAISINAGGAGFTDSVGRFWSSDRGFNTGQVSSFTHTIANTIDDPLFQNERWDAGAAPELKYSFAVPNGSYLVRLHFAENYERNFGVGRRRFDVKMEGSVVLANVDVFAEAGARSALTKSAEVQVTDGQINIEFLHRVQNPIVDALEIVQIQQ